MAQWTARGEASHLQRLIRDRIVLPLLMQVAVGRDHRTRFVHDEMMCYTNKMALDCRSPNRKAANFLARRMHRRLRVAEPPAIQALDFEGAKITCKTHVSTNSPVEERLKEPALCEKMPLTRTMTTGAKLHYYTHVREGPYSSARQPNQEGKETAE